MGANAELLLEIRREVAEVDLESANWVVVQRCDTLAAGQLAVYS